jgi:hypothetical protein
MTLQNLTTESRYSIAYRQLVHYYSSILTPILPLDQKMGCLFVTLVAEFGPLLFPTPNNPRLPETYLLIGWPMMGMPPIWANCNCLTEL